MKLIAEIKTKVIKVIKCLTAVFIIATVLSGCSVLSNYNETNFDGYTISLVQASIDGDLNEVKLLVGEGADLEIRNNEGWTPLMVAAYYGYIDIAKFLVGSGAKVDVQNNKKFTALMHSASKGHYAMSKYLVDSGSNVNTVNDRNEGALVWAVKSGNFDIVKLLVESGADINALEIDRYSPLWCSIEHGAEMFGYLLDNGAEIQPLVVAEAIESGNKKIVGLILNKGVSEDVQYMNGRPWDNFLAWSPLMFATCYGDIGMVEYIMDRGHGLNKPNAFGQLPIHSAAAWCSKDKLVNIDMIKFLMSKNIDIDKKTTKGISKGTEGVNPLAIAACAGKYRKEFVNFLLEFDVDVNAKGLFMDRYKFAPKCVAKAGDLDTFKKLVLKGADVNSNYGDIMTMAVYRRIRIW